MGLPGENPPCFLALLGGRDALRVVTPGGAIQSVSRDAVHDALCAALEAPYQAMIEDVFNAAGVPFRRQDKARRAMLLSLLAHTPIPRCWHVQQPVSAPVATLARQARLTGRLGALLGAHTAQYVLWLLAWW